jgi:hypothetical protein
LTVAKLRFSASAFKTGRMLQAFQVTGEWTELGVTWNNRPATKASAAITASRPENVEWVVTSHVRNMYIGTNYGFLVRDKIENGADSEQVFRSREVGAGNSPKLIVTFGTSRAIGLERKDRAWLIEYRAHVLVKKSAVASRRIDHRR